MQRFLKLLTLFLVLLMLVQSTVVSVFAIPFIDVDTGIYQAAGQPSKYSSQYNSGQRDVVATTLNGTSASSYYTGSNVYDVLSEKSSTEIKNALASLMKSTHSYQSSYNDCHYKADRTDCENEDKKVSLIYTGYSATMSQWNGWNREHVWPQSLGGGNTSGGGADLHHIRPSDAVVNSTRGNKKYGEVTNGTAKYGSNPATGYLGGYYNSTYFEPLDNVKGDVARIVLYVWVRWGSAWGADSVTEVFQSVDVLLEWMIIDPVDTWELGRNEVVQDIQGNRNVFIDYPEYAWLIFGKEIPEELVSPSGEAQANAHHWDNGSITTQPTCTTTGVRTYTCTDAGCHETKTEVIVALGHSYNTGVITTNPSCTTTGIKTYTCTRCNATKTESLKANGHSYGDWIIDKDATETETGEKHRVCSACSYIEIVVIPLVGHEHVYDSVITDPTCSEKGYTTHTCNCGESYIDSYTNTTPHNFSNNFCLDCGAANPELSAEDFSNIVSKLLVGSYIGEYKFTKICEAISIYNALSDEEKATVKGKYNALKDIVAQYNEEANSVNVSVKVFNIVYVDVADMALLYAAYTLLNKKYY